MVFKFARLLCLRQAQLKSMNCLMWGNNRRGKKKSILFPDAVLEFLLCRYFSGLMIKAFSMHPEEKSRSVTELCWELYPTLAWGWTLWSKAFFLSSWDDPLSGRHIFDFGCFNKTEYFHESTPNYMESCFKYAGKLESSSTTGPEQALITGWV